MRSWRWYILLAALVVAAGFKLLLGQWALAQRPAARVTLFAHQTVPNLGACQGVTAHDGRIYLYGDAQPGVIREYSLSWDPSPRLQPTGRKIALTENGESRIPHPTGLAFHADLAVFLGNTVRGQGEIYCLDWDRALADENLDHAILNVTVDDQAVNGSRPCYVRKDGQWLIATADYGNQDNALRLYDPKLLAAAQKTSEPGVCVASFPCGPWVQNLAWLDDEEVLLFANNQIAGSGWQLCTMRGWDRSDLRHLPTQAEFTPHDELEGFCFVDNTHCIACSSSAKSNVWFGRVRTDSP